MSAVFIVLLLALPVIIIWLAQKVAVLDKIGVVVLAFVSGLIFSFFYQPPDPQLAQTLAVAKTQVSEIAIALAIPLLLFSIHIPASLKLAGSTIKAMLLACIGMCVATAITSLFFTNKLDLLWQAAGMMVGAYTGGGQNIGAVKAAINANDALFVDMLTYDIVISAIYLLVAMTILKPLMSRFLPAYQATVTPISDSVKSSKGHYSETYTDDFKHLTNDSAKAYTVLVEYHKLPKLLIVLCLAAVCIGISLVISQLFSEALQSAVVIISLTSLGALLSFTKVRAITSSYQLGMLLIIVFCFVSGSMADASIVAHLKPELFGYIGSTLLLAMVIHALLCRIFKIDVDTFVVSSTAAIMSVPFIPMVTTSIKNKALLFPGIAAGVMGYILGNYLGVLMAYVLHWWL